MQRGVHRAAALCATMVTCDCKPGKAPMLAVSIVHCSHCRDNIFWKGGKSKTLEEAKAII